VFFLQAEDGIRDATVTGVQTCALPISSGTLAKTRASRAMLEYASTDARGEDSASSGASIARKHLTDESKKARSWYWFARHMQLWAIAAGWPQRSATATASLKVLIASPNLPKPL